MKSATPLARGADPIFTSYVALANGLVGDLTGICLLDGSLKPRGALGQLAGERVAKWIRSLRWSESHHMSPTASECDSPQWWIGIPLEQSDGSLLGIFCVSQSPDSPPTQPSRFAADLALRLKPLLDCIHRDLANALPVRSQVQTLTERSAELEWLFKVTSNLKAGVDDKRILEQLVAEATSRLSSALGVLYVPDKRLTVKCENDKSASAPLLEAWSQTREHLIIWVQRQNRPLVVNTVGREAAQRYQLLPSIDRWVMQRALQMLTPYRGMLRTRGLAMSINVSGQSIGDETFIQRFTQLLADANLPRHSISVELTEQAAITNLPSAKTMVARLGASGCGFALDDFGTGANSLTYLKALQVSRVKIDGSFVRDIQSDRNCKATVKAIVELAKGMGIETVAEYVETQEIAQEVRLLGVDYAQGYAFGKPEPLDGILEGLAFDESRRLHRLFLET